MRVFQNTAVFQKSCLAYAGFAALLYVRQEARETAKNLVNKPIFTKGPHISAVYPPRGVCSIMQYKRWEKTHDIDFHPLCVASLLGFIIFGTTRFFQNADILKKLP